MSYTLEQLAADLRTSLAAGPTPDALEAARRYVERALADAAFVSRQLPDRAADANPREILYEDKDLGFCICGHVYPDKAYGKPHDHGTSWAIYGQASGVTEMTDWRIVEQGRDGKPTLVEPARTYDLTPGKAHVYGIGAVHSPRREKSVKLIRIEGANLDHMKRSNIKAKAAAAA